LGFIFLIKIPEKRKISVASLRQLFKIQATFWQLLQFWGNFLATFGDFGGIFSENLEHNWDSPNGYGSFLVLNVSN